MRTAIRITSVILCLILLFCLFSCGASMERLEARAKKAGYACITVSSEELAGRNAYFDEKTDNAGDIVSIMLFQKDGKTVEAFEFDTVSTAEIYVKLSEISSVGLKSDDLFRRGTVFFQLSYGVAVIRAEVGGGIYFAEQAPHLVSV